MKTKFGYFNFMLYAILFFSQLNYGQAQDLGSLENFVLYSSDGAVGNTGVSHITGDIGTDIGAITGFELPTILIGNIHNANTTTEQAKADLIILYSQLFSTPTTFPDHGAVFGGGETLTAGVYEIGAAGSISGNLILNAQGDPNAVFIFKFGGEFTTAASASVTLINGALATNVFWISTAAIAMATKTAMKGR